MGYCLMGRPTGFLEYSRLQTHRRPPGDRVKDYKEFEISWVEARLTEQAARCMDCGVPGCHDGCPLGNLIPDWNDLVYRSDWKGALAELHRTNNFPEVTGRVCPAPCETVCTLAINDQPVTIKAIEKAIIDQGFSEKWVKPQISSTQTWKKVAIVGSGPAGLAGAQQLARKGHMVTVFEKSPRPGGLLTYGIPDFKLNHAVVTRRIQQLKAEGVVFVTDTEVGRDLPADELLSSSDAVLLAGGAQQVRPLEASIEGRDLEGIHYAVDFLSQQNRLNHGEELPEEGRIDASGKRVVILGGGDTGADCVGTSIRQGAAQISSFEILPKPESVKYASSHEEGGGRRWNVLTKRFRGHNGRVSELEGVELEWLPPEREGGRPTMRELPGTNFTQPADLVLLAMGFTGPLREGLLTELGVEFDPRGAVKRDGRYMTNLPGVFVAGDMTRGASLVVWAIWEGRQAAHNIDQYLASQTG